MKRYFDLDQALEDIQVEHRTDYEDDKADLTDWPKDFPFAVSTGDDCIIALFKTETAALHFRLAVVNQSLNKDISEEYRGTLFGLSMAAYNNIQATPFLIEALEREGYLSENENEKEEDALHYLKEYLKDYNRSKEENIERFKGDLHYWSDRWCYSRAYTVKYLWENVINKGK